jgi:hypothetical protein
MTIRGEEAELLARVQKSLQGCTQAAENRPARRKMKACPMISSSEKGLPSAVWLALMRRCMKLPGFTVRACLRASKQLGTPPACGAAATTSFWGLSLPAAFQKLPFSQELCNTSANRYEQSLNNSYKSVPVHMNLGATRP